MKERSLCRLVDSNVNRAKEGFRVIEDTARFLLEDKGLCSKAAALRHAVTDERIMGAFDYKELLDARDASGDCGFDVHKEKEFSRNNAEDVLRANFRRVQESLRVLEECLKLTDTEASSFAKTLRYKAYDLEKTFFAIL